MIKVKDDISIFVKCIVLGICIMLNLFALSSLFIGGQSISALQSAKESLASIKEQIAQVDAKNARLSYEIRLLQADPSYLEKVIRQQLNYVKGQEILYIFKKEEVNPFWNGANIDE